MNSHFQAKIDANRKNARKSTGPRTPEGKARSSRNAIRHGLTSGTAIMADEDELHKDFELLLADLRAEHQPDGPTEDILVYKMAQAFFATIRASVLLAERLDYNDAEDREKQVSLMLRYHTTADRSFSRNLADLRELQRERQEENSGHLEEVPAAETEEAGFVSQQPESTPAATPAEPPQAPGFQPKTDIPTPKSPEPAYNIGLHPFRRVG